MQDEVEFITPDWKVPRHVHAYVSLRKGGVSQGCYQGFNLASHVGDISSDVMGNRSLLGESLCLAGKPHWLNQIHSTRVIELSSQTNEDIIDADAAWTEEKNQTCVVLTADCLPVFFYHPDEQKVAVTHAGWRGLVDGIIEKTIQQMTTRPEQLVVWLGPAIGPCQFEVGEEVMSAFCNKDAEAKQCFEFTRQAISQQHFLADIYQLAKRRLYTSGVTNISGGDFCTVSDPERFFSYRRDGQTGRMANLIWMTEAELRS